MSAPGTLADAELLALAIDIADHASRSDIESYCVGDTVNGTHWYDLTQIAPDDPDLRADIDRAERYLDARGLLRRSITSPHRVYFPAVLWSERL